LRSLDKLFASPFQKELGYVGIMGYPDFIEMFHQIFFHIL